MTSEEAFIITQGDHIYSPVGPFPSEEAAHSYYRSNQPRGQVYLREPVVVRLLSPHPAHVAEPLAAVGGKG